MSTFASSDRFEGLIIGVARDDDFDVDDNSSAEVKKRRLISEEHNSLLEGEFMRILCGDQDKENIEIQTNRSVERLLPHILSAYEDYKCIELFRQFPINEFDTGDRNQDQVTANCRRMDPARSGSGGCGLQDPLQTDAIPRPFPRMHCKFGYLQSSTLCGQTQKPQSPGDERLDDPGNTSAKPNFCARPSNECHQQDARRGGLEIHPYQQDTMVSSKCKGKDHQNSPAANQIPVLVDQDETTTRDLSITEPPQPTDILMGRGSGSNNNPGNKYLMELVAEYLKIYKSQTSKDGKKRVLDGILMRLRTENRRFLKLFQDGKWSEMDYRTQYDKIGHIMRDIPNPKKATGNRLFRATGKRRNLNNKRKRAKRRKR